MNIHKLHNTHPRLICAVCGVLAGSVYYFTALAFLIWLALIPVIYYLLPQTGDTSKAHSIKMKRRIGVASFFVFPYFLVSYLVGFTIDVGFEKPTMLLIDLGLILVASLFQGIPQVAALAISTRIPFPVPIRSLVVATFWVFSEWLSMIGIFAFPVRTLASTQWKYAHFIQAAGLLGELFVSFIIIVIATLIAQELRHLCVRHLSGRTGGRIHLPYLIFAIIIFLADAAFGFFWQNATREPLGSVQVIAVQPNTGMNEKNIPRFNAAMELAADALEKYPPASDSRLVVFPESTAQYLLYSSYMQDKLSALAADYDTNIIVGGLNIVAGSDGTTQEVTDIVSIGKGEGTRENGVYFIDKDGNLQDEYYTKQHRVPFFENGYLYPFEFLPGDQIGVFQSDNGKVGAVICLESVLPSVVRASVRGGANIVVVPTNDAYLSDAIKKMHFSKSVFRALEVDRDIVQATTDGVSGVAFTDGTYQEIDISSAGVYVADLNMRDSETLFIKIGNAWVPCLSGLCVLIAVSSPRRRGSLTSIHQRLEPLTRFTK